MTEDEIYEFDLNGYILYRDLIPAGDLRRMNDLVTASTRCSRRCAAAGIRQ